MYADWLIHATPSNSYEWPSQTAHLYMPLISIMCVLHGRNFVGKFEVSMFPRASCDKGPNTGE